MVSELDNQLIRFDPSKSTNFETIFRNFKVLNVKEKICFWMQFLLNSRYLDLDRLNLIVGLEDVDELQICGYILSESGSRIATARSFF